jgi:rare lipoprotein A
MRGMRIRTAAALAACAWLIGADAALAAERRAETGQRGRDETAAAAAQAQRGEASYYAPGLHGRRMANGERFDRNSNSAAHRTLPLGTRARVTNLETGRSEVVEIEDRGPHVRGRIIDVSPRTAERLGMREEGTARVEVQPIERPRQR